MIRSATILTYSPAISDAPVTAILRYVHAFSITQSRIDRMPFAQHISNTNQKKLHPTNRRLRITQADAYISQTLVQIMPHTLDICNAHSMIKKDHRCILLNTTIAHYFLNNQMAITPRSNDNHTLQTRRSKTVPTELCFYQIQEAR